MTTDDRNFRSTYYEKVGCRSVEEKKSLEILLKEKPLNRLKLKQFCLSYTVPSVYRNLLWNLLLDVAPVYPDCHTFVMNQRSEVYDDLNRALQVMNIVNERTPLPNIFYAMWLLENRKLSHSVHVKSRSNFVRIAEVLQQTFENKVDLYWLTKGFYNCAMEIMRDFIQLKELTHKLLEEENLALYRHLDEHNLLNALPLEKWYGTCFSGILSHLSLIRIWDKIIGGSRKIVVFVFIVLFCTIWRTSKLSDAYQLSDVFGIIKAQVRDNQETAELIVNKSIELWQQNKEHAEFRVLRKSN